MVLAWLKEGRLALFPLYSVVLAALFTILALDGSGSVYQDPAHCV